MTTLIDITGNESALIRLLALHGNDLRRETLSYSTLKNYLVWLEKVPNLAHTKIYTYGNWQASGLYLIVDRYYLMVSSLKPNDSDLSAAMKLLDWTNGFNVFPVAAQQRDVVLKVLQDLQIPHSVVKNLLYKLPREAALNWRLTCPADYDVSTLTADDVDFVNSLYPPRNPCSTFYLRRVIDFNESVALRSRNSGELVAWCTRCYTGLLGSLQVIDECQRQGLATFVVWQFAQKMAALGEDVWTSVRESNEASIALFEKLKFQYCGSIDFCPAYKPVEQD